MTAFKAGKDVMVRDFDGGLLIDVASVMLLNYLDMKYIDIATASVSVQKSERTLYKWIKANKKKAGAVRYEGRTPMVSVELLKKDYPFNEVEEATESFQNKKDVAQLSLTANTLEMHQRELNARNDEIKRLLSRKNYTPLWLTLGFVAIIVSVLPMGYLALQAYLRVIEESYAKDIMHLKEISANEIEAQAFTLAEQQKYIQELEDEVKQLEQQAIVPSHYPVRGENHRIQ